MTSIFTIGHSTHEPDAFVALLAAAEIELLVDVRRFPSSRRFPWFSRSELHASVSEAGIGYLHIEALGGRRDPVPDSPNGGWRVGQFRGYADHMESAEFRHAVDRLIELAHRRRTAVVCAEAQWWRCHRRLLSDVLLTRDVEVLHLDARGRSEPHELTPFAVVEKGRLIYPPEQGTLDV
ncbi:MAG TPA: DUF488 domain-containing protein [Thermoleophilaceae bacterium]|nr:DUF488 domain-containing protein [Thermoleophilaceae bacterium]